jgi:hypothetical protein
VDIIPQRFDECMRELSDSIGTKASQNMEYLISRSRQGATRCGEYLGDIWRSSVHNISEIIPRVSSVATRQLRNLLDRNGILPDVPNEFEIAFSQNSNVSSQLTTESQGSNNKSSVYSGSDSYGSDYYDRGYEQFRKSPILEANEVNNQPVIPEMLLASSQGSDSNASSARSVNPPIIIGDTNDIIPKATASVVTPPQLTGVRRRRSTSNISSSSEGSNKPVSKAPRNRSDSESSTDIGSQDEKGGKKSRHHKKTKTTRKKHYLKKSKIIKGGRKTKRRINKITMKKYSKK